MNEPFSELSRGELLQRYGKQLPAAAAGSTRRPPFKFLDSYDADDADIFFGRDEEIEELLRHFHGYGHVLIYGESGAGKSSLVQCGLRARIPQADALFIPLRVHTAGLPALCRTIGESASRALGERGEVSPQWGLVDTLREVGEAVSRPIVLFFDQFEELFIFHDAESRRRFVDELAAIRDARLNVKVIIGVRQDYLAHLSELEDAVEGLFDNRFWLRRMSRENAVQAVVKACGTCGVQIDADLAEAIIGRLDPGGHGVELPFLQVVMDRLYRQAVNVNPDQPVISNLDVQKLGDVANILGTFLVEEVGKLPEPDMGRQILKAFVTRQGTRRTLDREAVAREAAGFGEAISPANLDTHLKQLVRVRILREIADADAYELRHDALAATVSGWISEVEKDLIEVRDNLVNRFTEYEARGRERTALLDEAFLDYLGVYRTRLSPLLNAAQQDYLETSKREVKRRKRVRQLSIGGGVMTVLALVLLVAFLFLWQKAEQAKSEAAAERQKFDEARKTVNAFFVTVSEDTLLNQPGMQDLRNSLLKKAEEFYKGFLAVQNGDGQKLDDNLRRELARTHYYLGEITRETKGDRASLKDFQTARDMQLELQSSIEGDPGLLFDLGNTLNALGRAHDNLQEPTEALTAYAQALEVRQELADAVPEKSEYQRKLASTIMNIGLVKRDNGLRAKDLVICEEAKQHIDRAQQIRLEQVEKRSARLDLSGGSGTEIDETLSGMQRDLAIGFFNLATFEEEMFWEGLKDEDAAFANAEHFYEKAIHSLKQLSDSNDMEIVFLLGTYYHKLGNAGDLPHRESRFLEAKERLEPLAYFNPKVKKYQAALAQLYDNLGVFYLDLADKAELEESNGYRDRARSAFKRAIEILGPWKDDDPALQQDWENTVERLGKLGAG